MYVKDQSAMEGYSICEKKKIPRIRQPGNWSYWESGAQEKDKATPVQYGC